MNRVKEFIQSIPRGIFFAIVLWPIVSLAAVSDNYSFSSPEQSARFHQLTQELRCVVCQNQSLADSNAPLAQDLRQQIADSINRGATDDEVRQYLVARYGDFVLLNPPLTKMTYLLWGTPFVLLCVGLGILYFVITKRREVNS